MPLLSRFLALQQASPLAALTQPQTTPQMGFEWQNPSMLPQAPQVPQGAAAFTPNKQATPGQGTPPGGWMSRLQSGMESPLFNIGMALMAGSQNGGDWGVVSDSLRGYGQDQRERQRLANEERAAKAQQNLQNTQFDWLRTDRQRADEQRQRYTNWASNQSDNPDASVDPEAAFRATQEARGIANQPITPYQQATLDVQNRQFSQEIGLRRRQLELDALRLGRSLENLSTTDTRTLNQITDASDQANAFNSEITRFMNLNSVQPTGPYTQFNPGSWFGDSRARRDEMEGITSRLISSVRAMSGEGGIMTDADALRFERGLPSVNRYGQTNTNISAASREVARNASDRVMFYEMYARNNGSLLGARSAWNDYLTRNPIYDSAGNLRENRPGFEEWMRAGSPDMRAPPSQAAPQQRQPSQAPAQTGSITPEQARAELARRERERRQRGAYGQQPGGYTGR